MARKLTDEKKLDIIIEHYNKMLPREDGMYERFYTALEKVARASLTNDYDFTKLPIAGAYDNIVCGKLDLATRMLADIVARKDYTPAHHIGRALSLILDGFVKRPNVTQGMGDDSLFWKYARIDVRNDRGATLRRKLALGRLMMFTDINKDWYDSDATLDGLYNYITTEQSPL